MRMHGASITVAALLACGLPVPVHAQRADGERARVQVGPFNLTPSVAVTNLGIDTNVFNEFDDPKRDFTFTLSPRVDTVLRVRRAWLRVAAATNFVYFQQYSSERSADPMLDGRFEVRGARFTPWIAGGFTSTRQRYGYEIDMRFPRVTKEASAGIDARLTGRTTVTLGARRTAYEHDEDAVLLGTSLHEILDRRSSTFGVEVRYRLRPLTTLVVSTEGARDRFMFLASRDTNSTRLDAGFDLMPFALISGRGRVGYRTLVSDSGASPEYAGLVASVAAGSTVKGRTRVDVTALRDVSYSFESVYPYFVHTGATLTITPRVTQRWDTQWRAGGHRLAYRAVQDVPDLLARRVDRVSTIGGGVGYLVGREIRIGFNMDRERRESPVQRREYAGYRTGISVTYGR